MARISGVNIPTNKKNSYSTNIYIWNWSKNCSDICIEASIDITKRVNQLNDDEVK